MEKGEADDDSNFLAIHPALRDVNVVVSLTPALYLDFFSLTPCGQVWYDYSV